MAWAAARHGSHAIWSACLLPLSASWTSDHFLDQNWCYRSPMLWWEFVGELTLIAVAAAAGATTFLVAAHLIPLF
jgi:hypothetical protein